MVTMAAVSCTLEEVGRGSHGDMGNVWIRPGINMDSMALDKTMTYVTAVEYIDRYDWMTDIGKGNVKCSLVVYEGGSPMMKIPVGDKYEVSSDPDAHRMVNSHLYTFYSADSGTVIKKDGREYIRYSEREMICDLVENRGDIYTLGHNLAGDGFACRKNGEVLFSQKRGSTFGRLHCNGDSISFAYREPIDSDDDSFERYYYVLDGEVMQAAVREDIKKVWDIVPCNGGVCYLASVVGVPSPVLFSSDGMQALSMPQSSRMMAGRIIRADGILYVEGLVEREGLEITSALWKAGGKPRIFANGMTISSLCVNGDFCCALNPSPPYMKGVIYKGPEVYSMPDDCFVISGNTTAVIDGILHVGLSSLIGANPLIWRDGETTPLEINGFITGISTNRD